VLTSCVTKDGEGLVKVTNVLLQIYVAVSFGEETANPPHGNLRVANDVKIRWLGAGHTNVHVQTIARFNDQVEFETFCCAGPDPVLPSFLSS
jgi:hypothetical protein